MHLPLWQKKVWFDNPLLCMSSLQRLKFHALWRHLRHKNVISIKFSYGKIAASSRNFFIAARRLANRHLKWKFNIVDRLLLFTLIIVSTKCLASAFKTKLKSHVFFKTWELTTFHWKEFVFIQCFIYEEI